MTSMNSNDDSRETGTSEDTKQPILDKEHLKMTSTNVKVFSCDMCKIQISGEKSLNDHLVGKKHLKSVADFKENECSLFVKGFPYNIQRADILDYFANFGHIEKCTYHTGSSFAIMTFEDPHCVQSLLKATHYFCGKRLWLERKRPRQPIINSKDEQFGDDVIIKLQNFDNFESQLPELIRELSPDPIEVQNKYKHVLRDMEFWLRKLFPNCQIYTFGSSVTGLEFKTSDIDIFVKVPGKQDNTDSKYLKKTKIILYRSSVFKNPLLIAGAKIPIIKCMHQPTSLSCDINFRNMLGVCNSKMLRYYLYLNRNVRETMFFLKHWAKKQEIVGQNHLVSSYALTLMFVFYLQQPPFCFPSVQRLQCGVSKDPDEWWNGNFSEIPLSVDNEIYNTTVLELLKGFFQYYANFSFEKSMVCPYLGKPLDKNVFLNVKTLPEEFDLYCKHVINNKMEPLKIKKPIVIQDPFELNRNCCSVVLAVMSKKLKSLCSLALEIITNSDDKSIIFKLLTKKPKDDVPVLSTTNVSSSKILEKSQIEIPMETKVVKEEDLKAWKIEWFEKQTKFILSLWENIMKFSIVSLDEETYSKNIKLEDQKDIHDCSKVAVYRATGYMNLWDGRKVAENLLKSENRLGKSKLESDFIISDYLYDTYNKYSSRTPVVVLDIFFNLVENPTDKLVVDFIMKESHKKYFKSMMLFFNNKFNGWFEDHKEMSKQE